MLSKLTRALTFGVDRATLSVLVLNTVSDDSLVVKALEEYSNAAADILPLGILIAPLPVSPNGWRERFPLKFAKLSNITKGFSPFSIYMLSALGNHLMACFSPLTFGYSMPVSLLAIRKFDERVTMESGNRSIVSD